MPFVRAKRYPQKCPKCGFQWMSYKPNPKQCPSCHRYLKKSTKKTAKPSYFCSSMRASTCRRLENTKEEVM